MNIIKEKLIPTYEIIRTNIFSKKVDINYSKDKKNIYMFLSADYGNCGDIAICEAQKKFIEKYYNYNVISVPLSNTFDYIKPLKKIINKNDIIALVGGGNFGNRYSIIDFMRLFIIKNFNNKIISFPQTIDFSNSKYGKRRLRKNIKTINKHKNIVLFAREKVSYDLMKQYFPNNEVYLCPDIVLSLDEDKKLKRKDIIFAFRNDSEKKISDDLISSIEKIVLNNKNKIILRDTIIPDEEFNVDQKEEYLKDILTDFSKAKLVITDRLHGMIFSYITSTPCIVLPNSNHKITSTYNTWLKNCNFIKYINDLDNIEDSINELLSLEKINKINLNDKFDELKNQFK